DTFFLPQKLEEQIFRATFRVVEGDKFSLDLADPSTNNFKNRSRDYRERINSLFRRSPVRHGYIGTEVLALDGTEGKDVIVHFNIHIDPTYVNIRAGDLESILAKEISLKESLFFRNLTIDVKSLVVKPSHVLPQPITSTEAATSPVTEKPEPPRVCSPLRFEYCNRMGYNVTTYPNIFKHRSIEDVLENSIPFRELVDAECYRHAYDFVCRVLQPSCRKGEKEDEMVLPCRGFCREFMTGCGGRMNENIKTFLDCSRFPEYGQGANCITKPG
ncbi:unnamed protein product, partial [Callosobruchus maculatus]